MSGFPCKKTNYKIYRFKSANNTDSETQDFILENVINKASLVQRWMTFYSCPHSDYIRLSYL